MLKNYKIILQYEGTKYQGWQKQDSTDNTIQGKLENILGKMTGEKIQVNGSGRTDAGVHALGQVANFKIDVDMSPNEIMNYMNQYLPEDIAVILCEEAADRFHARLNAVRKTYQYRVLCSDIPHVFSRRYVYQISDKINENSMRSAASLLLGIHDFKAFTSSKKGNKSTIRTIESIKIEQKDEEVVFTYIGDGFLYHMVRILTGTLLEVGSGLRKPEDVVKIIESGNRENAGFLAPAQGLTLVCVDYCDKKVNIKDPL